MYTHVYTYAGAHVYTHAYTCLRTASRQEADAAGLSASASTHMSIRMSLRTSTHGQDVDAADPLPPTGTAVFFFVFFISSTFQLLAPRTKMQLVPYPHRLGDRETISPLHFCYFF